MKKCRKNINGIMTEVDCSEVTLNDPKQKSFTDKMIEIGSNVISAPVKIAKVVAGIRVSSEDQKKRLDICNSCEHKVLTNCTQCGCVIRFKVLVPTEKCPVGKWQEAEAIKTEVKESKGCGCGKK